MLTIRSSDFLLNPHKIISSLTFDVVNNIYYDCFKSKDFTVFKIIPVEHCIIEVSFYSDNNLHYISLNVAYNKRERLSNSIIFTDDISIFSLNLDDINKLIKNEYSVKLLKTATSTYEVNKPNISIIFDEQLESIYIK